MYSGNVRALDRATFTVEQGEHCCLLGPNGAGKTTIIRLLEGALTPTSGVVSVLGADASGRHFLHAKRSVGVVPQSPGLYPDLTVREYLTFVRDVYGAGTVDATAEEYGLGDFLHRRLSALSGGYQRRLVVTAAILSHPTLLLLDEPTVGLDPLAATQVRSLLRSAMKGRTVFMSTHNLAEAEELCDSVIILRGGTVLVHERIEDLQAQAVPHVYLVAREGPEQLTRALLRMGLQPTSNESSVALNVADPESLMPTVLRDLLAQGIGVYECRVVPPTLEDLFVKVVTQQ